MMLEDDGSPTMHIIEVEDDIMLKTCELHDYSYTVIGVPNLKYVWIMSRKPELSDDIYNNILDKLQGYGFDLSKIKKIVQSWD